MVLVLPPCGKESECNQPVQNITILSTDSNVESGYKTPLSELKTKYNPATTG